MKVMFWTASHLPDLGGFQWSTYRLAKMMKELGHEPAFLTGTEQQSICDQLVPAVRIPCTSVREWTEKSGQWLLENRSKFDVIHSIDLFYKAIDVQLDFLLASKLPTVIKIPTMGYIPKLINSDALRRKFSSMDALIALSEGIKSELTEAGISEAKIHSIPNGIDMQEFTPACNKQELRNVLQLPESKVLILFAGRLVYRKRVDVLLEATASLSQTVHLVLVGSSFGQRDSVEEQILQTAGTMANVTVREATAETLKYYQACDINVLLSEREGLPNAVLEGMSCSMPTVATDIAGITNVISSGYEGILVPVDDVSKTSEALMLLAENQELRQRMGQAARRKVKKEFDISVVTRKYLDLYQGILKGKEY